MHSSNVTTRGTNSSNSRSHSPRDSAEEVILVKDIMLFCGSLDGSNAGGCIGSTICTWARTDCSLL